ncbi:MAG: pyruvate dehydrogenase (acetyl-transferring) E1 component subunit alpha [Armatimonadetes bacterium]|nr:pyruvate dehydrogenase (acetyl-transferring) E1 component subunit alpha [Armatimonadota bacterium]
MAAKDREQLLHFYEDMLRIRFFEEKVRDVLLPGKLFRGSSHLAIGQEAVAVGAIHALREDDLVVSTHRGHGHAMAKGLDPRSMFAEVMGRKTGCCRGKGGSMHLSDAGLGFVGENPVVGSNTPMAAGLALAAKLEGSDRLVAAFFGEGALNTGAFHEAANLAALWQLPVLFLCEDNLYAISVPLERSSALQDLERRAEAYGIQGQRVNGMRVMEVYEAVSRVAQETRERSVPSYLVFDTYRFEGHHTSDKQTYRTRDEALEEFRKRDPIHILEFEMIDDHTVPIPLTIEYRDRIRAEIDEAFEQALQEPWPEADEALAGAYAEGGE